MAIPAHVRFKRAVKKHGGVARVAAILGCSASFVSLLQNGKKRPGGERATRIQHEFKIPAVLWYGDAA